MRRLPWISHFPSKYSLALSLLLSSTNTFRTEPLIDSCFFVISDTAANTVECRRSTCISTFFVHKLTINILKLVLFLDLFNNPLLSDNSWFLSLRGRGMRITAMIAEIVCSFHILVLILIASAVVSTWSISSFFFFIVFYDYFFKEWTLSSYTRLWWALTIIINLVSIFIF